MKKRMVMALGMSLAMLMSGCTKSTESSSESTTSETALHATVNTVTLTEGKFSDEKLDDTWDEKNAVKILCEGSTVTASSENVSVSDGVITIGEEGTYILSGTLTDGQVVVDVADKGNVKLVFNGISLTSTSTAPVYVKEGTVVITLAPDTENTVTDGQDYVYEAGENEPKAAIFAKDDLTFNGTGSLTVNGKYNNGIQCKDDLKFVTGTYYITAANNGIVGKDSVSIKNGNFTIDAGGDGIKATNIDETDKGYIIIEEGAFTITAGTDGIQAETMLRINDGDFEIVTGGGSQEAVQYGEMPGDGKMSSRQKPDGGMGGHGQPGDGTMPQTPADGDTPQTGAIPENGETPQQNEPPQAEETPQMSEDTGDSTETDSMKGLKSYVDLIIAGGDFDMDVCDDGVHSNQNVTIDGGTLAIQAGDDGIHADQKLTVNGGNVDVQKSYEGLEGIEIEINGGNIQVIASDDGINAAGDDDSAANPDPGTVKDGGGQGGMGNKMQGGMAGEDQGALLTINGGNVYVNANGDGLDANGDIYITGGTVTVHGPTDGGNGTLDFASECRITGGTFLADGSVGMAQNPSDTSTQPVIIYSASERVEAGTAVSLTDGDGTVLLEYTTEKTTQWFAFSAPELKEGNTYTLQTGDISTEVTAD